MKTSILMGRSLVTMSTFLGAVVSLVRRFGRRSPILKDVCRYCGRFYQPIRRVTHLESSVDTTEIIKQWPTAKAQYLVTHQIRR